jgi:hypothetical protein
MGAVLILFLFVGALVGVTDSLIWIADLWLTWLALLVVVAALDRNWSQGPSKARSSTSGT